MYRAGVCVRGRRETATFDTRLQALIWAEETEGLLREGLPLPGDSRADLEFTLATDRYTLAVSPGKKPNTRRLDQEIARRLVRHFGGRMLGEITPADIAAYRDHRLQRVGPSSVIHDLSFLSCLYRMARVEWGLAADNPAAEIRRPSAPKHRLSLLRPAEIGGNRD